jgi:hypothetical protein
VKPGVVAIAIGVMVVAISTPGVPVATADSGSPPLSWSAQQTIDSTGSLDSVACPATGDCVAVGSNQSYDDSTQAAVLEEQDGTWTPVPIKLPIDASAGGEWGEYSNFSSVACSSIGNCAAAGTYLTQTGAYEPLVVDETDGTWGSASGITEPTNAGTFGESVLTSVSCPAEGACVAVGNYWTATATAYEWIAVTQVDGVWQQADELALPAAASAAQAQLSSIDCTAVGTCEATGNTGQETTGPSANTALFIAETGGQWGDVTTFADQPTDLLLASISCWSAGNCEAGGAYVGTSDGYIPAAMEEVDGVWGPAAALGLPGGASSSGFAEVTSVSCPAAGQCLAVGSYLESGTHFFAPLVYDLDNGAALPNGLQSDYPDARVGLAGSCSTVGVCTVLGGFSTGGPGSWVIASSPSTATAPVGTGASGSTTTTTTATTPPTTGLATTVVPATNTTPRCVVPRVLGEALSRARRELRRAHCSVGKLTIRDGEHHHGALRVFKQSGRALSVHHADYRVNLDVRRG